MAEQLTEQQKQAVLDRGGCLLVSAAAGSGKTKVLVDRLLSYLTDPIDPANIDDFLMITYTKAAAAELRGKIAAKLTERVAQEPENVHLQRQLQRLYLTKISTVHSFCGDILREYAYLLNLPSDFRVADENECFEIRCRMMEKILTQAYENQMSDPYFRAFVDSQGLGRDDRQVPQIVMQIYDSARCHLAPEKWLRHCLELVHTEAVTDAAQTEHGGFLMERLKKWLAIQIRILEDCTEKATCADGFQKPAALLADTVFQLRRISEAESWEQVIAVSNVDFGRLTFPKNCADEELKEQIKAVRDACKKGLEKYLQPFADDSVQILKDMNSSAEAVRGLIDLVIAFGKAYDGAKQSRRVLDFGDLEHKMLDLLLGKSRSGPTAAAVEIGKRFREVMVDEYQDSNEVQDAIYGALTHKKRNLFMVGDVKQSIYQFRLADPGIFLKKYHCFIPANQAEAGQDRKVILSRNFRSSGGVLEGCNDVFRLCMSPQVGGMSYGEDEALYEGIPHIPLGQPEVELHCVDVQQETYPEEAAFVAAHIKNMLENGTVRQGESLRPVVPEDIVILLRSPGSAGKYYQQALEQYGIRYTTGDGTDLLKTEEIETFHAILQTIYNPRLDIPLIAALSSPAFGLTADDLASLRSRHKSGAFYDAVCKDDSGKIAAFMNVLQRLRNASRHCSLTGLLDQVLLETSLEEVYAAMDDGQARLANIRAFYQLAVTFEAGGNRDLGRFLEYLQLLQENGMITSGEQSSSGCVTIMSIHKSKGLEFPVVYLCGLSREFNMESQRAQVLCHKQMGLGLSAVDVDNRLRYPTIAKRAISAKIGEETVSEELRVLYVAMTRARDRLIMTYASKRLQKELTQTVLRLDMGGLDLLCQEALCPGDWVLLAALHKIEAGELFALSGKPQQVFSSDHPWKICVQNAPQQKQREREVPENDSAVPQEVLEQIQKGLSFRYGHTAATSAPSKMTATGLKGRYKDEEAAEQTPVVRRQQWRKPSYVQKQMQGKEYGNAIHAVMQYIDYGACETATDVQNEVDRLYRQNYITQQQAQVANIQAIADFFSSDIGKKLRHGEIVREFKFSILQDAAEYDSALSGEKVLLQGVVDCALLEDDGLTIIDFKTDFVTAGTLAQKVDQYAPQINAYAEAMMRIFEKPVKEKLLYFFHLGETVAI